MATLTRFMWRIAPKVARNIYGSTVVWNLRISARNFYNGQKYSNSDRVECHHHCITTLPRARCRPVAAQPQPHLRDRLQQPGREALQASADGTGIRLDFTRQAFDEAVWRRKAPWRYEAPRRRG